MLCGKLREVQNKRAASNDEEVENAYNDNNISINEQIKYFKKVDCKRDEESELPKFKRKK